MASFANEARVGQKNKITRRWARRGARPSAPKDQRTASAYIFGAICPKDGKGAALVMPRCDTEAMNLHLAEIATQIAPGAHAALLVDLSATLASSRSRMASLRRPDSPAQYHGAPVAGQMSGTEPAREYLAVFFNQICCKASGSRAMAGGTPSPT